MLGLDPNNSCRRRLRRFLVTRFSGLRFASPENDGYVRSHTTEVRPPSTISKWPLT